MTGWFRRSPMPYLELYRLEVLDGSEPSRTCYSYWANLIGCAVVAVLGFAAAAALLVLGF